MLATVLIGGCNPDTTTTNTPQGPANAGNSTVALGLLKVAAWHPMTGYSRDHFPHWKTVGTGCDVRDEVLERDGTSVTKSGCNVTGGSWLSIYDNLTLTELDKVDIDHVVPLANAWRTGADKWTDAKRSDFANDLERPQLRAVSAASNRSKGDQDPSQWKPPKQAFWCEYAEDWITVKSFWQLTVTQAEKDALTAMLGTCS